MNLRVRSHLASTPAYRPGKTPAATAGKKAYKLSSNEHHLAPLPAVLEAAEKGVQTPASYADPGVFALTDQLAGHLGVDAEQIVFGAGASEVLSAFVAITGEPGTDIIYPWPSFEMYAQLTSLSGANAVAVPLTANLDHDLPAMLAAISDTTRLILLCSPNNPTGASLSQAQLVEFLDQVPDDIIVVLDEAYREFNTDPDAADSLSLLPAYPNLAVLRTFSKAHGLAGYRIGYTVTSPEIVGELRKALLPFGVSAAAQNAASASLDHIAEVEVRAKEIAAIRDDFIARLREVGAPVADSQGNYVWLAFGEDSAAFEAACREEAVAVRNLDTGVRVSIGPEEALDRVVKVAKRFGGAKTAGAAEVAGKEDA